MEFTAQRDEKKLVGAISVKRKDREFTWPRSSTSTTQTKPFVGLKMTEQTVLPVSARPDAQYSCRGSSVVARKIMGTSR